MGYSLQEQYGVGGATHQEFGTTGIPSMAEQIAPSANYTMTQMGVFLYIAAGTPLSSALSCSVYSDSTNTINSLLATATNTRTDTLTGSPIEYLFQFSGLALTNGLRYWVVLNVATPSNVNYPALQLLTPSGLYLAVSDGSTWTYYAGYAPRCNTYIGGANKSGFFAFFKEKIKLATDDECRKYGNLTPEFTY